MAILTAKTSMQAKVLSEKPKISNQAVLATALLFFTCPNTSSAESYSQKLREIPVQSHIAEPVTTITLTPHRVKSQLTQELHLERYPLTGSTPEFVFKTVQDLRGVRLGETTVDQFLGGLPISFSPGIEQLEVDGRVDPTAKFSVVSWVEYIPLLKELVDKGVTERDVYPSYAISYRPVSGKMGDIKARVVLHKSDTVYRKLRGPMSFPFEKSSMSIGLTSLPGMFNLTVMPIDGLTTRVDSAVYERVYPFKRLIESPENPISRESLTITGKVPDNHFWFFKINFERTVYEKLIIVLMYALPFLSLLSSAGKIKWTVSAAVVNVLVGFFVFEKYSFSYMDVALLVSIIVSGIYDYKNSANVMARKKGKKRKK